MNNLTQEERNRLLPALLGLWESSVRATHTFLAEEDILALIPQVQEALLAIESLYCRMDENGKPVAFLGVESKKIEMLFVDPDQRGKGIGKDLLRYAVDTLGARYVDVNEQNGQAVGFYRRLGFRAFARSALDGQGRPFPLLHLLLDNPGTLETERLLLIPLTERQLEQWCDDLPALEEELHISYRGEALEGFFLDIVKGQLDAVRRDPDNYLYHSFWLIMRREDRIVVGSADFKRPPDHKGQVEIGYGIAPAFERQGYTTEAVREMCRWALSQASIKNVVAETDLDNRASHRVLEKCGFHRCDDTLKTCWWRLAKENSQVN